MSLTGASQKGNRGAASRCLLRTAACLLFIVFAADTASAAERARDRKMAGKYLYADYGKLEKYRGSLVLKFQKPGRKVVVAYGRRFRKPRFKRGDVSKDRKVLFKPCRAEMSENGRNAVFPHLPPDYYDIAVIDIENMVLAEGIQLLIRRRGEHSEKNAGMLKDVRRSLGKQPDGRMAWEAFFDSKKFERCERHAERGGVLLQQLRHGKALAESGAVLKGTIHSIDMAWLQRTKRQDTPWRVVFRQQLYRGELDTEAFFDHCYWKTLRGIRVGAERKKVGPLTLPAAETKR